MEVDTFKLIALGLGALASFLVLLLRGRALVLHGTTLAIFFGLLLISIHYVLIGFSVNETNNDILFFGFALWFTIFLMISAFEADEALHFIKRSLSFVLTPVVAYLLYLQVSGAGISDYGYYVGISENPNIMGAYLALFIVPIAVQNLLDRSRGRFLLIADLFVILTTLYLIYLTGARGAALAVAVSVAYVAITSKLLGPTAKAAVVVSLAIAVVALQDFLQKYQSMSVIDTRQYLIILRLEAIAERPWFGWGLAADVNNSFNGNNIFPPQEKGNTFLQFVEEFGVLIGCPLFIAIIGLCVAISMRCKSQADKTWIVVFLLAALTHSMVETWMLNFRSFFAIAFWLVVLVAGVGSTGDKVAQGLSAATRRGLANSKSGLSR